MRILLAAPDRDILMCYERLLSQEGHEVTTAFDGMQLPQLLAGGGPEAAILDPDLPGLDRVRILRMFAENGIPVIALGDIPPESTDTKQLRFLRYPFLPEELFAAIGALPTQKSIPDSAEAASGKIIQER
ncbi:MAG: response regulator transcription factor [Lachnospiraceae bacterium]|nr:response regulator transcription factor [Lachnospiraceae bacterium]